MLPAEPGNTLVFIGTLSPTGSQFPAGTTFTVLSSDPSVEPIVDETGLIVTVPLPEDIEVPEDLTITWASSTFQPSPSTSPSSLQATILIGVVAPPAATPTVIMFAQTT